MPSFADLAPVWNWLPAFRAAAESEHLPTAAAALGITPSAVSRTLRNLEEALGTKLFERVGRRIQLNGVGREFLTTVRSSMRQVHGALARIGAPGTGVELRVAGSGLATLACAVPMLMNMRARLPRSVAQIHVVEPANVASGLLRGDIDLAVLSQAIGHPELECFRLGHATNGLYCGPQHPLVDAQHVDLHDLQDEEFIAPLPNEVGSTTEGWPAELPRCVVLRAQQMHIGAEACRASRLLAVLPDYVGRLHGLSRLPTEPLPVIPIFAVHRPHGPGGLDYSVLVRALADALAAAGGEVSLPSHHGAARLPDEDPGS